MGVPKFFRWISERYPNLSVSIENSQLPAYDCLYLDMNGIIHVCSHPDDNNVQFRITEDEIFSNIFKYIDFLFKTVKPREVFFLAIDGVAPRAKMNQQRGRRFKASKEANDRDEAAIHKGIVLPSEKRFDSNAITPGTVFMNRLQYALREFLSNKVGSDSLWHGVDVILSGHETPGEGEHKIQEFIRYRRSLPTYNPNTRHCLYGLDADLILLGLASHEPYFSLLREEVIFSPKNKARRAYIAEETKFYLLHISLLRKYIDYEFYPLKVTLGDKYNLERIIDDWIVLSFFVGNDFVPHLPNFHIHTSALPILWETYIKSRPHMSGYMNTNGQIDIGNYMIYITDLGHYDHKHFKESVEEFTAGTNELAHCAEIYDAKPVNNNSVLYGFEKDLIDFEEISKDNGEVGEENNDEDFWKVKFDTHKTEYYYNKLGLKISQEMLCSQATDYFIALQWISYYYFNGVRSWSWFYPQHYAPFVSDLVHLTDEIKAKGIQFDIGKPFLPFEQLMAVLPSDSADLLPHCYSILMTMDNSPIKDFYPKNFKTDLNGKKMEWEALVLIPFIDEKRLLLSLETHQELLTDDEKQRNIHGPHVKFKYSQRKVTITDIDPEVFRVPVESMVFGLCPNVQLDVIYQGFPTFKHIAHSFSHERAFVKIFENHSTSDSIVLRITPSAIPPITETVAQRYLDQLAYVNWPAFLLIKVVAVLDRQNRLWLDPVSKRIVTTPLDENEIKKVADYLALQTEELYKKRAVVIDQSNPIILETLHSEGNVYQIVSRHKAGCSVRLERNWICDRTPWHLLQMSVLQETIEVVQCGEVNACTKLSQLFPIDSLVFCLDPLYYGQSGKIMSINNSKGSMVIAIETLKEPEYCDININDTGVEYITITQASEYLGIDSNPLSKITGSVFIGMYKCAEVRNKGKSGRKDRQSIGLELKNNKLNLQIPGWVVKTNGENGSAKWLYSMKVVQVLDEYRQKFPEVFEFIKKPNFESLSMEDLFEVNCDDNLLEMKCSELRSYLDSLEYRSVERLSNDHELLTESQISNLEQHAANIDEYVYSVRTEKPVNVELEFKDLYRWHHTLQGTRPDKTTEYRLWDRVVCCTDSYTVPLGARGVVVGIEPVANNQSRLEILFDKEFTGAISIRGSKRLCYRVPMHTLINTTHGFRRFSYPMKIVRKIAPEIRNHQPLLPSVCRNTLAIKKQAIVPEIAPLTLDNSLSSELLKALFSTPAAELPPMPSKNYSENNTAKKVINVAIAEHLMGTPGNNVQHLKERPTDLMVHCDQLFQACTAPQTVVRSSPRTFTTIINASNCPAEYAALFLMCKQCGVVNPTIIERHVNNDIFMSFTCDHVTLPETRESDLVQARVTHVNRVWQALYSFQQNHHQDTHQPSPPPPLPAAPYVLPEFKHYFVPAQFQGNPFTEMYPSRHLSLSPTTPNSAPNCIPSPSTPVCIGHNVNKQSPANSSKPFIHAPKSKMTFPKS